MCVVARPSFRNYRGPCLNRKMRKHLLENPVSTGALSQLISEGVCVHV